MKKLNELERKKERKRINNQFIKVSKKCIKCKKCGRAIFKEFKKEHFYIWCN